MRESANADTVSLEEYADVDTNKSTTLEIRVKCYSLAAQVDFACPFFLHDLNPLEGLSAWLEASAQ